MIKAKHFMDGVEDDDGIRIWVEPVGLTRDLCQWCRVAFVLTHVAPPRDLWLWFSEHPREYSEFRGRYHEFLQHSPFLSALLQIACLAGQKNFTFLHQSDDPAHNTAVALHEFISELEAHCQSD
jgi:uncharacterized protein YeaO (DUF488 family)